MLKWQKTKSKKLVRRLSVVLLCTCVFLVGEKKQQQQQKKQTTFN